MKFQLSIAPSWPGSFREALWVDVVAVVSRPPFLEPKARKHKNTSAWRPKLRSETLIRTGFLAYLYYPGWVPSSR